MSIAELTTPKEIDDFLTANKDFAVVHCYTEYFIIYFRWCQTCQEVGPYMEQKSKEMKIPLIKIHAQKCDELREAYKIKALPTFLVLRNHW